MTRAPGTPLAPVRVGAVTLAPPLVLAPMAGITDMPFRRICKRMGAGLVVTEMVASRAVHAGHARTERIAEFSGDERPVSIQIAGAEPGFVAEAARWAEARGADLIDINMGCPVKKICNQMAGSALLKDERRVAAILRAVVRAVSRPVTLKIRTGWDERSKNVERIARIAEDEGIAMLTVHGRTRAQMFRGRADWEDIGRAKAAVSIPVIGNGDVVDAASALRMLEVAGCDGVMIGRAAQGNPWIFREVAAALAGRPLPPPPAREERLAVVREHLAGLVALHGEQRAVLLARKHVPWYARGLPGASAFRGAFQRLARLEDQLAAIEAFFLEGRPLARAA